MPRRPDLPCAGCGTLLWRSATSLPEGEATCRGCRRKRQQVEPPPDAVKACSICREIKPVTEFRKHQGKPYGRGSQCRPCASTRVQSTAAYRRAQERRDRAASYQWHHRTCETCGEDWKTRNPEGRFCSMECYGESLRGDGPASRPHISMTVRQHVYDRDGWQCQLCGGDVAMTWQPTDPERPSLDHIVPVSVGGDDAPENLQLAHLSCNVQKGARSWGAGEQLLLVG